MVVLFVTSQPLNKFAWLSVLLLAVVGVYFVSIPLKLLKEMADMERLVEKYKNGARKSND